MATPTPMPALAPVESLEEEEEEELGEEEEEEVVLPVSQVRDLMTFWDLYCSSGAQSKSVAEVWSSNCWTSWRSGKDTLVGGGLAAAGEGRVDGWGDGDGG